MFDDDPEQDSALVNDKPAIEEIKEWLLRHSND
jgi:hypothetical protein